MVKKNEDLLQKIFQKKNLVVVVDIMLFLVVGLELVGIAEGVLFITILLSKEPAHIIIGEWIMSFTQVFIISIGSLFVIFLLSWLWIFVHYCRWPQAVVVEPPVLLPKFTVQDVAEEICSICLEDLESAMCLELPCGHQFHTDCVQKWLNQKPTCALCRRHIFLQ